MKSIIDIITETGECGGATPCNTIGMGNPLPTNPAEQPGVAGAPGSEPVAKTCKKCKKKKNVVESLLDDEDKIMADAVQATIKNWLYKQNFTDSDINDFWDIKEDGTLFSKIKQYEKYVHFVIKTNDSFPGKWGSFVPAITLDIDGPVDWKELNLPPRVMKLTVMAQGGKINLEGLKQIDGEGEITIYDNNVSAIKFDPRLAAQKIIISDWRQDDGNLDKIFKALPKKVAKFVMPKSMAAALLSRQMGQKIEIR